MAEMRLAGFSSNILRSRSIASLGNCRDTAQHSPACRSTALCHKTQTSCSNVAAVGTEHHHQQLCQLCDHLGHQPFGVYNCSCVHALARHWQHANEQRTYRVSFAPLVKLLVFRFYLVVLLLDVAIAAATSTTTPNTRQQSAQLQQPLQLSLFHMLSAQAYKLWTCTLQQ